MLLMILIFPFTYQDGVTRTKENLRLGRASLDPLRYIVELGIPIVVVDTRLSITKSASLLNRAPRSSVCGVQPHILMTIRNT